MAGHDDMPEEELSKGADGFRVEERYLLAGSDVPYRVTVTVEYPQPDNPFHEEEDMKVLIGNSVLMRLLDRTTEQARIIVNENFPS